MMSIITVEADAVPPLSDAEVKVSAEVEVYYELDGYRGGPDVLDYHIVGVWLDGEYSKDLPEWAYTPLIREINIAIEGDY